MGLLLTKEDLLNVELAAVKPTKGGANHKEASKSSLGEAFGMLGGRRERSLKRSVKAEPSECMGYLL